MGEAELQIAQQAFAAFNRGDIDGALQHVDPDIEWNMSEQFTRTKRVFSGHAGAREVFTMFGDVLDEFHAEVRGLHDAGDAVIAEVRVGGTFKGTGERSTYDVVQVWTMSNRKAVRLEVYPTLDDAWASRETMPPPSSSDAISD